MSHTLFSKKPPDVHLEIQPKLSQVTRLSLNRGNKYNQSASF